MSDDSLQALAEQVVDLLETPRSFAQAKFNGQIDPVKTQELQARMRDQHIARYCKHFSAEQLQSLLDFYTTPMGQSIVASHVAMAKETHDGFRLVSGELRDGKPVFD